MANNEIPDSTSDDQKPVVVRHRTASPHPVESSTKVQGDTTLDAIREGLADLEFGRTKPARAVLRSLTTKYGISLEET